MDVILCQDCYNTVKDFSDEKSNEKPVEEYKTSSPALKYTLSYKECHGCRSSLFLEKNNKFTTDAESFYVVPPSAALNKIIPTPEKNNKDDRRPPHFLLNATFENLASPTYIDFLVKHMTVSCFLMSLKSNYREVDFSNVLRDNQELFPECIEYIDKEIRKLLATPQSFKIFLEFQYEDNYDLCSRCFDGLPKVCQDLLLTGMSKFETSNPKVKELFYYYGCDTNIEYYCEKYCENHREKHCECENCCIEMCHHGLFLENCSKTYPKTYNTNKEVFYTTDYYFTFDWDEECPEHRPENRPICDLIGEFLSQKGFKDFDY